jgi:transcription elongation factor Elf1
MGIIDKTTYTLTCPDCGNKELASVLDKGSSWGGSSWQSGASFQSFNTQWSGGGNQEPKLISASCKNCGSKPTVESGYGG